MFPKFLLFLVLLVASVTAHLSPFHLEASSFQQNALPKPKFHNFSEALAASEKTIIALKDAFKLPSLEFGFSVRGKPILQKAWGFLDLENAVPANINSVYRLASISKTFTSVVIGNLVDQGLVRYSDPLSLYLKPNVYPPKSWGGHPVNITIAQLLSHTSGEHITDPFTDFNTYEPGINCTHSIAKLLQEPLNFQPGTAFNYSNYGYQLLGAVIESVTKKPYQHVLQQFFRQHNLTSSYVETAELIIHNKARYYMAANATAKNFQNIPGSIIDELFIQGGYWSSGGLMSNVPDLLRYGQMLIDTYKGRNSNLVSQEILKQMWTSRTSDLLGDHSQYPPGTNYGYGWVISDFTKEPTLKHRHMIWHNGGLGAVSTWLMLYPEEEAVGVALTNKGNAHSYLEPMIVEMMENVYEFCVE